jgi:hypothetical protein
MILKHYGLMVSKSGINKRESTFSCMLCSCVRYRTAWHYILCQDRIKQEVKVALSACMAPRVSASETQRKYYCHNTLLHTTLQVKQGIYHM